MEVCLETNRKAGLPRSRLKQYKTSEGEVGLGPPGGPTRLALHLESKLLHLSKQQFLCT